MSHNPSNDPQNGLQELLRIKRLEKPENGFSERFLQDFQQRQRSEMMRRSSFEIFWDRLETLLGGSARSRYALAGAATALFVVVGISLNSLGNPQNGLVESNQKSPTKVQGQSHPVNLEKLPKPEKVQMERVDLRVPNRPGDHVEF